jgi:alpha-glucosidase
MFRLTNSGIKFAGAGSHVGKWLGDNLSLWDHYRQSIAEILEFASLYQVPMVGADVCGFGGNTTETLCARWAMLGAFYPFYRNHNGDTSISQEYYLWQTVTEAARNAIAVRYRLLDYIYTHLHRQSSTGLPMLNPLFFQYPEDQNTFAIEHQFFYGDNILVSPVLEENSTDVSIYLPKGIFYDYWTHQRIEGNGSFVNLTDVPFTSIPLHIRGGSIIPLRAESANTTTELRKQNFVLWIAVNETNQAEGSLYLDDGDSLVQNATSEINFNYNDGSFTMTGTFGYPIEVVIQNITILGDSSRGGMSKGSTTLTGPISLKKGFSHGF